MREMRMHLFPLIFAIFKVGCHIEWQLPSFWHPYRRDLCLFALLSKTTQLGELPPVQFD